MFGISVNAGTSGIKIRLNLLAFGYVTGFVKIDPNHTGTEIHFIGEH